MLTANRLHQFLNSAREWEAAVKHHLHSQSDSVHRIACNDNSVIFEIDLPGYEREDLHVEVKGNELLIQAESADNEGDSNCQWRVHERENGAQSFRFELPFQIDPEKTETKYEHGVLRLIIQKPAEALSRKLTVK